MLATLSASKTRTEIAAATGLAGETVSSILSELAKAGEVCGADRGYTLADGRGAETAAGAAPTPSAAS